MDVLPKGRWLKTLLQQRAEQLLLLLVDVLPEGWRLKTSTAEVGAVGWSS